MQPAATTETMLEPDMRDAAPLPPSVLCEPSPDWLPEGEVEEDPDPEPVAVPLGDPEEPEEPEPEEVGAGAAVGCQKIHEKFKSPSV
jgi:hypothetical protein